MCLSMFLKRRKADLLQNIWEQSTEQSQDESSDKKVNINFLTREFYYRRRRRVIVLNVLPIAILNTLFMRRMSMPFFHERMKFLQKQISKVLEQN